MLHQPREQLLAITFGSLALVRHQVIDIHAFAPPQVFEQPKTSYAFDDAILLQKCETVALPHLSLHPFEELTFCQARPQLRHDGIATENLVPALGNDYAHSA